MALKITDNFNYTGRKPNFQRDQFATTSEMNAYTVCDEGHISYNLQDNKHYSFKNGAWSVLQTGGGGSSYTHPSSHPASIITYDSSETYESGNVGYEIKQLVTSLAAKYVKPGTGIPKADLANDVQTSLGYADDYNTNKSSFLTSAALETALEGLSPYNAGTGIAITTVSNGKQIAVDTAVYKVKDVQNASGISLVNNGIATIPNAAITSIKDSGGNDLTVTNGAVTLPAIPTVPITQINKSDNTQLSPVNGVVTLPAIPSSAADISFDDTLTQLSIPGSPVNNVQQAIQKLAIGISGGVSTVRILLKKNNEQVITNQQVNITVTYQGETFDLTTQESYNDGFYTGANGIIELLLPLGAVYNITYSNFNDDYSTPDSISGIVDRAILNITGLYVAISENESILFVVNVLGADASVRPTDKEIYIDIYNQQNTPVHTYTCILASNGTPKTIKDTSNNVIKTGTSNVTLDLAKNVKFRARLQLWDTNLTEEEQSYIASGAQERTTRATRFTMYFSYQNTQTGLFLVVKDSSKAKGFAEYKITNIDTTNNIININIEGIDYTITKDSNNIIYKKETADSSVQPSQWFTVAESSDILGIGCRTSTLIAAPVVDQPTNDLGFTNCCFVVPRIFIQKVGKHQNTIIDNTYFDCWSNISGIHQTRQLSKIEGTMVSPVAQDIIANNILTLSTPNGNVSINGFACSTAQFTAFNANINNIFFLLRFINGSSLSTPLSIQTNCYISNIDGGNNTGTKMNTVSSYTANLVWQSGWNSPTQSHTFFVFYPF